MHQNVPRSLQLTIICTQFTQNHFNTTEPNSLWSKVIQLISTQLNPVKPNLIKFNQIQLNSPHFTTNSTQSSLNQPDLIQFSPIYTNSTQFNNLAQFNQIQHTKLYKKIQPA